MLIAGSDFHPPTTTNGSFTFGQFDGQAGEKRRTLTCLPVTHQYACRHMHGQRHKGTHWLTCMCLSTNTHDLSTIYKRYIFFHLFFSSSLGSKSWKGVNTWLLYCFNSAFLLFFSLNKMLCMFISMFIYIYIFFF